MLFVLRTYYPAAPFRMCNRLLIRTVSISICQDEYIIFSRTYQEIFLSCPRLLRSNSKAAERLEWSVECSSSFLPSAPIESTRAYNGGSMNSTSVGISAADVSANYNI